MALFDTNIEYRVSHKQPSCIPLVLKNSFAFGHVSIPGDNAKQISPRFLPRGMRESLCGSYITNAISAGTADNEANPTEDFSMELFNRELRPSSGGVKPALPGSFIDRVPWVASRLWYW